MSSRGLCNRELMLATRQLRNLDSADDCRIVARQLAFVYRCFLHEVAEAFQVQPTDDYRGADRLLKDLRGKLGEDVTIAELDEVEKTPWLSAVRSAESVVECLKATGRPTTTPSKDLIKAVQVAENEKILNPAELRHAAEQLSEFISRTRLNMVEN